MILIVILFGISVFLLIKDFVCRFILVLVFIVVWNMFFVEMWGMLYLVIICLVCVFLLVLGSFIKIKFIFVFF